MGTDVGSTGLGVGGGTGHDTGGLADVGAGAVHGHHHSAGTGLAGAAAGAGTGAGLAAAPMAGHHATTPADTGMVGDHSAGTMMGGAAAAGAASDAHKPLGQKIKEHLPGGPVGVKVCVCMHGVCGAPLVQCFALVRAVHGVRPASTCARMHADTPPHAQARVSTRRRRRPRAASEGAAVCVLT
jgi:hypothetical protein